MSCIIVIIGAPGVGKGTQARMLAATTGYPLISADELQSALKRDEWLTASASQVSRRQSDEAQPEAVTRFIGSLLARPEYEAGLILDGWPHNLRQALELEEMAEREGHEILVYRLTAPEEALLRRLNGRRICSCCGESYNTWLRPPQREGVCDLCGASLLLRDFEPENSLNSRLSAWQRLSEPLSEYFRQQGQLVDINAARPAEDVFFDLCVSATGLSSGA